MLYFIYHKYMTHDVTTIRYGSKNILPAKKMVHLLPHPLWRTWTN